MQGLRAILDLRQALIASRPLREYLHAHRQFHFALYDVAGLSVLSHVPLLRGTDFNRAALAGLDRRDAEATSTAVRHDIEEAGRYIMGPVRPDGWIAIASRPQGA